jgi:O-antigen ligase
MRSECYFSVALVNIMRNSRNVPKIALANYRDDRIRQQFRFRMIAPATALIMWVCLWCNLNSGFWNIVPPSNLDEWQLAIRAILPFGVLPVAFFFLVIRKKVILPWSGPSRLLMVYGCFAAIGTFFSPEPGWSLYWTMNFLATILVAWNFLDRKDPVGSARQLLQVTWAATFVVAAIIGYQAQGSIFGHGSSAYGLVEQDIHGLSRSSGIARWAAIPGLVCLVKAYHSRRIIYFPFYLGIAGVAFFIVYRMQSRGAVFGSIAALLFTLVVGSRLRRYALPFAIIAMLVIFILDSPAAWSNKFDEYIRRGQSKEEFRTMTGRTHVYEDGMAAFADAPIFGRGQWADRLVINQHVHNSFLQAMLNSGVTGAVPYFLSWGAGWLIFFRLQKRRLRLNPEDRICVLEAGTVMMFFTVRAIPETTTASYAVDLLVMVAVYVYLETLLLISSRRRRSERSPVFLPASSQAAQQLRQAS